MLRAVILRKKTIDVLLTEGGGGFVMRNFYFQQTKNRPPTVFARCMGRRNPLDDYNAADGVERTLLPEANYRIPDGKVLRPRPRRSARR